VHLYFDKSFEKIQTTINPKFFYDLQRRVIVWTGIASPKNAEKFAAFFANPGSIGRNEDDTARRFHRRLNPV
jgi:hypothetical protein